MSSSRSQGRPLPQRTLYCAPSWCMTGRAMEVHHPLLLSSPTRLLAGGVATLFNAGLNIANRSRFSIIRDDIRAMSFGSESIATYKTYAKGAWPVEYLASGGTIGDIATGAIHFIIASSNPGAALGVAISNSSIRIRYYD